MTAPTEKGPRMPLLWWTFFVLEVVALAAVVVGVALIYVPAAYIVGGLIGVVGFERAAAQVAIRRRRP